MKFSAPLAAAALTLSFSTFLQAGNWPNWRGPNFNGTAADDEKGLPEKFSPTENVLWSADLPGPAASTPAIWGDHIFVTAAVAAENKVRAMCLDRKSGKVLWEHAVGDRYRADDKSNFANPSPVTDGKLAVFFFGTGDLVAYDFAGKQLWARNLEKDFGRFAIQWTPASSPMLADGRLYFQVLQRNESFVFGNVQKGEPGSKNDSYILAVDPKTGKDLWKVIRPSEAVAESLEAFSTPIPFTHGKRSELLITGGDCITGHDPATGKELWRWGTWNPTKIGHWRLVTSPSAGAGVVLACGPKQAPIYAVKLGGNGQLKDADIAWNTDDDERKSVSSDVATPAFYKGKFFIVNGEKQSVSCVDPSGKILWNEKLDGGEVRLQKMESSPTIADGKLYIMDHRGTVVVVEAGDTFKQLAVNQMGSDKEQYVRSTVAVAAGQLFVRSNGKLYCIGKK